MKRGRVTPAVSRLIDWIGTQHATAWVNVDDRPRTSGATIQRALDAGLAVFRHAPGGNIGGKVYYSRWLHLTAAGRRVYDLLLHARVGRLARQHNLFRDALESIVRVSLDPGVTKRDTVETARAALVAARGVR